jgi:hypothetical protein
MPKESKQKTLKFEVQSDQPEETKLNQSDQLEERKFQQKKKPLPFSLSLYQRSRRRRRNSLKVT